jgi:hypothetical protein
MCLGTSSQGKDGLKIETEGKSPMHSQPATFTCGLGPWTLDHQHTTQCRHQYHDGTQILLIRISIKYWLIPELEVSG